MFDDMPNPYEDLYIWDSLEKRGFPIGSAVQCIHLNAPGVREVIVNGDPEAIQTLMNSEGRELSETMVEVLKTFVGIMFKVYADQPDEKRMEILEYIKGLAGQ
jgi:hypothetical protein